jgi:hypothetical protein
VTSSSVMMIMCTQKETQIAVSREDHGRPGLA